MSIRMNNKLYIIVLGPAGGAWGTAKETAIYWATKGHNIEMVGFLNQPMPDLENIKTSAPHHSKMKSMKYPRFIEGIIAFFFMLIWFAREKPQKIISVGLPMSVGVWLCKNLCFWIKKPIHGVLSDTHISAHLNRKKMKKNSLTFKTMAPITHNQVIYKWMFQSVDLVICLSKAMADDLVTRSNVARDKIHVIPPFINPDFFDYPLPDTNPQNEILFVGRLSDEKNVGDILKAFQIVLKTKSDARLTLIGDGDMRGDLEKLSKNLGIDAQTNFVGRQSDVASFHAKSSCQLLTSHYEGFPLSLVEACANGVPMVSYDGASGPRDAITDGVNGYVVAQYDVKALAEAIVKTLDQDWDRNAIRESATKFRSFNVQRQYQAFLDEFEEIHRQLS